MTLEETNGNKYEIVRGHDVEQSCFHWYVRNLSNGNLYGFHTKKNAEAFIKIPR